MRAVPLFLAAFSAFALSACAVGSAVGTAVSVTGSAVSTVASVTGSVVSGAARTVTGGGGEDEEAP